MQFNSKERELTLKVVYYGPALSGKTTNIQALHQLLAPGSRGRLMNLDTKGDRTLFFDLLPVHFNTQSGYKIKIKLFTVPGQVVHESTRRIVLAGSDAIVFVADAQRSQRGFNNEAYAGMVQNLQNNGIDPNRMPTVIQFNKMDLPDVLSEEEIDEYALHGSEPIIKAIALRGLGVVETLRSCMSLLWGHLEAHHDAQRTLKMNREEFMNGVFQLLAAPPEVPR